MNHPPFHQLFIEESLYRFNESTPRIQRCLAALSEEQVWQKPNASSNSVGNLILHLCGNIRQYIVAGLGGQPDIRKRDAEFAASGGFDKETLQKRLLKTTDQAIAVMKNCSEAALLQKRMVQGFELTGVNIIIHVVEHYSYHTGQIAFWTKLLLDKDLGFYAGMDLNIKNA